MAACATTGNQPAQKTFTVGDIKLLEQPAAPVTRTATVIVLKEFQYQGKNSGAASAVGSVGAKDAAMFLSGGIAMLPAAAIAAAVSMIGGAIGSSIDAENAKMTGYEITYRVDGSETTVTIVEKNLGFKLAEGDRIKVVQQGPFAPSIAPL